MPVSTTSSKPKLPAFCSGKQRFNPIEIARYRARDNIQVSASQQRSVERNASQLYLPSSFFLSLSLSLSLSTFRRNVCFSRTIAKLLLDLSTIESLFIFLN